MQAWLCSEKERGRDSITIEGGVALPGLTDAHMHPLYFPILHAMGATTLAGMSKQEVLQTIKERHQSFADQSVPLLFLNLDTTKVQNLTAAELSFVGERDVAVIDASSHGGIASAALCKKLEERTKTNKELVGRLHRDGVFTEDYSGEALAILQESFAEEFFERTIEQHLLGSFSKGVTAIHDLLPLNLSALMAGLKLRRNWQSKGRGRFPITRFFVRPEHARSISLALNDLEKEGILTEGEWRDLVGIKLFADGSLGSRTALLAEEYSDRREYYGIEYDDTKRMEAAIRLACDLGLKSVAVHAIGDAGIEHAMFAQQIWWQATAKAGVEGTFRIEHFELPTEPLLRLVKQSGAWVVPQPNFLLDCRYKDRLGKRVEDICPHNDILRHGIPMMFGTDGIPDSMLYAIYLSTHAQNPNQRIGLLEALNASSATAAAFDKDNRGVLEENQQADLIIADAELIDRLSPGQPDISHNELETSAMVGQLEASIRCVYKSGVEVYNRQS